MLQRLWHRFTPAPGLLLTDAARLGGWDPERACRSLATDLGVELQQALSEAEAERQAKRAEAERDREAERLGAEIAGLLELMSKHGAPRWEREAAASKLKRLAPFRFENDLQSMADDIAEGERLEAERQRRIAEARATEAAEAQAAKRAEREQHIALGRAVSA
ncbi:MAG: hypothetical protein KDC27_17610 [Acidobacteria bacterium]|nr:hypothetical protein [Acidobacteriota bacterium]